MQKIVQVITSLFECVKKENNDIISNIKDLREETNKWFNFWLKGRCFNFRKKVNCQQVSLIPNINQYGHGDELVISRYIIPHGSPTQNVGKLFLTFFGNI